MGAPNYSMIPAAILLQNPGITREEFVELLNKTKVGPSPNLKRPWTQLPEDKLDLVFHSGLHELGEILGLRRNASVHVNYSAEKALIHSAKEQGKKIIAIPENKTLLLAKQDEYTTRTLFVKTKLMKDKWQIEFQTVDSKEILLETKTDNFILNFKPEPGKLFHIHGVLNETYRIAKILDIQNGKNEGQHNTRLEVDVLNWEHKINTYDNENALKKHHPNLTAENIYDWTKNRGNIHGEFLRSRPTWQKKGDKYYLENPLEIKKGRPTKLDLKLHETMYGDLIVTSEALKKEAWSLFGFYGYMYPQKFLVDHPDSFNEHHKSMNDYWLYRYAKNNSLTISEYMRLRLEAHVQSIELSDQEALKIVCAEAIKGHGGFDYFEFKKHLDEFDILTEYLLLPKKEKKKDELPF